MFSDLKVQMWRVNPLLDYIPVLKKKSFHSYKNGVFRLEGNRIHCPLWLLLHFDCFHFFFNLPLRNIFKGKLDSLLFIHQNDKALSFFPLQRSL